MASHAVYAAGYGRFLALEEVVAVAFAEGLINRVQQHLFAGKEHQGSMEPTEVLVGSLLGCIKESFVAFQEAVGITGAAAAESSPSISGATDPLQQIMEASQSASMGPGVTSWAQTGNPTNSTSPSPPNPSLHDLLQLMVARQQQLVALAEQGAAQQMRTNALLEQLLQRFPAQPNTHPSLAAVSPAESTQAMQPLPGGRCSALLDRIRARRDSRDNEASVHSNPGMPSHAPLISPLPLCMSC
jgi:hypothetical protein